MSLHESRSLLNKDRKMISGTGDTKQLSAITHSRQRVLSWRTIPGPKSVCLKVGMVYRNVLYQNKRLYPTHHFFYWKHHVLMACKITVKSGSSPNLRQALTHLMFLYVKKIYSCYFTSLCLYIEYIYIYIIIYIYSPSIDGCFNPALSSTAEVPVPWASTSPVWSLGSHHLPRVDLWLQVEKHILWQ